MDLRARADHLAQLMGDRLDIRGDGFEAKLANAGRRLPRYVRREGARIAEALEHETHPKLSRQIDVERLNRSAKVMERFLFSVDPWARRKGIFLNWLAGISFSLLVVLGLVLYLMARRGLL